MTSTESVNQNSYAAIDLGSNSFHMVIAQLDGQSLRLIDRLRDSVRLGSGLDEEKNITPDTEKRALECLALFEQRLRGVPAKNIRVVGTNSLRRAKNAVEFSQKAFDILGKNIDVISGREEARLIYSAVSHGHPKPETSRLIIDIGGGSTELIIGKDYKPTLMESTNMGCVSFSNEYFPDGVINDEHMRSAILHAELELQPLVKAYQDAGWDQVMGCSGTIKSTLKVLTELKISKEIITRQALRDLCDHLINVGHIDKLNLTSINKSRSKVIIGGIAILYGLMRSLKIDELSVSQVALREGVIYDMIGKKEYGDVRENTITKLLSYYRVDDNQSKRVANTAKKLFAATQNNWGLDHQSDLLMLHWASRLHEIGLLLAHSQYHKHGAYILQYSDMLGFSRMEQSNLALLVRYHRRKLDVEPFKVLPKPIRTKILKLLLLLRISALFHRDRVTEQLPEMKISVKKDRLNLSIDPEWLQAHPLTTVELVEEIPHAEKLGIQLAISPL